MAAWVRWGRTIVEGDRHNVDSIWKGNGVSVECPPWVAFCLEIFFAASALLYGGIKVYAFLSDKTHFVMHQDKYGSSIGIGHAVPCGDQGFGGVDCCMAGPGCSVCVPLALAGFTDTRGTVGALLSPTLEPSDAPLQFSRPRHFMTI